MKSKLKFIVPLVLVIFGGVYKFALAKPPVPVKKHIDGEVYVLPKDFLLNIKGGKFAKLDVALELAEGYAAAPPAKGEGGAATPPDGYGVLPQEAAVRAIATDVVTDASAHDLVTSKGRERITLRIRKRIRKETDVKVNHVLLTDVAVQ